MKTLLLSEIFPPENGGSGRWLWEVYSRLPKDRFIVVAGEHEDAVKFDATHDSDVRRLSLTLDEWGLRSWKAICGYWSLFRQLRQIVKREDISAIHCGRCLPEGWLAYLFQWLYGIPYVCYVHGEDVESAGTSRELSWMVRGILANSEFLIANSHNTASLLHEGWNMSKDKVRVIHPGVDTKQFAPAARNDSVQRQLGWHDRTVVLTVGRLQKRKGHDMMIRALASIREAVPDVLYSIIGNGEERETLQKLVTEHNVEQHVQFLGEVSDEEMIQCYQQCNLFALPNRQVGRDIEGFGMVLLEAQSCGRPVLAGASGGTRETMTPGETGAVAPCDSPDQVAAAVTRLLLDSDHLESMGRQARVWAVENFDWSNLSRQAGRLFGVEIGNAQPDARKTQVELTV